MSALFYLFCVVCVCIWLIGWGFLIAERITQKNISKFNRWLQNVTNRFKKGFWVLIVLTTCVGCVKTTDVQIKHTCPPMLRTATYNAMQTDELADYRIAVEQCKV